MEVLEKLNQKIELRKSYKNGFGEDVKIVTNDEFDKNVFLDSIGRSYYENGRYFYNSKNEKNDKDLLL